MLSVSLSRRYDAGTLEAWERTPAGGLRIPAFLTRVGVLVYREPSGLVRRELRLPDEVFAADSLATLPDAPVTDLHPPGPVTPENWRNYAIGHVATDVRQADNLLAATVLIEDATAIARIEAGERREISCGYTCELENAPGVWNGEQYDAIQRGIRYNHVAIGPSGWGRAGPNVALRLDSDFATEGNKHMRTVRIDGIELDADSEAGKLAVKLQGERDTLAGRADAADKRVAALEGQLKDARDPAKLRTAIAAKTRLVADCARLHKAKGARFDADEAAASPDVDLMSAAIKAWDPTFDPAGKSEEFIRGVFTYMVKDLAQDSDTEGAPAVDDATSDAPPMNGAPATKTDGGIYGARAKLASGGNAPGERIDSAASAAKLRSDSAEAWKAPLAMHK